MRFKYFLGIDISKMKVDLCLFNGEEVLYRQELLNQAKDLKKGLIGLMRDFKINFRDLLICAEYTGMYVNPLILATEELNLNLWMENPAEIKLGSGVQRGKNDKVDAERIAVYSFRFLDRVSLYESQGDTITELKYLTSERDLLVKDRAKYMAQLKDQPEFVSSKLFKSKEQRFKKLIKTLDTAIKQIENRVDELIKEDNLLKQQFDRITSIKGIGKQVATYMILVTQGFSKYSDARKFACYAGVAPFRYTSGSSQHSKSRVSYRANKKIKYLLHMAALSSIQNNSEIKAYYDRKVQEGKNKMTILNAIRSKLIHRMFAVVRDNREYENSYVNHFA